jgi:hypothetical protein
MIDHDSQLIAFLSGGALTAEERQRVAAFVAAEVRRDASTWYKKDVEVSKDLQLSRENPGAVTADLWQKWRWNYAISAAEDVEAQIVAAHDPVLAFDRERTTLIAEQTIRSLRDAAAWVAQQTGRPQPDAQYSLNLRNTIRQQWRTWPNETLSSLTYIVKDFPATVEYMLGVMSDTQRREFLTSW